MVRHLSAPTVALAFLSLALAVRLADNGGAWWPILLAWGGGICSGVLLAMLWVSDGR